MFKKLFYKLFGKRKKKKLSSRSTAKQLILSQSSIDAIITYEISSESYYNKRLKSPICPGADSGVTIGIGYHSKEQFEKDWKSHIPKNTLEKLGHACGKKKSEAKQLLKDFNNINIEFKHAKSVFIASSLPKYAKQALTTYPGLEHLKADAQGAIVSLVFNRGASTSGETRKEMYNLKTLISEKDYNGIANEIQAMKRLWADKNLEGLLKRRDNEAKLVRNAKRDYQSNELITVAFE